MSETIECIFFFSQNYLIFELIIYNDRNMENLRENIIRKIESNKGQIISYGVSRLGIFGSAARNESTDSSDIDFIVEFEEGKKNYKNLANLYFYLTEIFQRKIDLLTEQSLKPYMKDKILKEAVYVSFN
ncbi:MAG: nucleotidyltransferase family protein [bacterium]